MSKTKARNSSRVAPKVTTRVVRDNRLVAEEEEQEDEVRTPPLKKGRKAPTEWTIPGEAQRINWGFETLELGEERLLEFAQSYSQARSAAAQAMKRVGIRLALREINGEVWVKRLNLTTND